MADNSIQNPESDLLDAFLEEQSALLRYFRSRSGGLIDDEDLAQELWIKLSRNATRASGAPRLYIWRIARTLLIDRARADDRRLSKAEMQVLLQGTPPATPEDFLVAADQCMVLREAIIDLPKRRREIFAASRLGGERHRDIAARLGVSVRTVELELQIALEHCAERLGRTRRR